MFGIKIKHSFLAELNLTGTPGVNSRYKFLDVPELRYGKVKVEGIQSFTRSHVAASPTQKVIIADADACNITCTFVCGQINAEEIQDIPYYDLIPANNGGLIRMFNDKQINLSLSGIKINALGTLASAQSVLFNILYYRF